MKRFVAGPAVLLAASLIADGAVANDAPAPLTESEAVARVLAANPDLSAAGFAVLASEELIRQADLRPNPELGVEWENLAGSGEFEGIDASEYKVALSQVLELGGKRPKRAELARREAALAEWDRQSLRLDLVAATREVFLEAWLAQEEWRLARDQTDLDERLAREIHSRHKAGAASPVDLSRAQVVVSTGAIAQRRAAQCFEESKRRLAALWGGHPGDFERVDGDFEIVEDPVNAIVPEDWTERNPDTAHWRAVAAADAAEAALARAIGKPDLEVGLGLKREHGSGNVAFVLEAGLPLPFFDRNEPAVRAAEYGQQQAQRLAEAAVIKAEAELEVALDRRRTAWREVRTLRDEIIPQAREAYAATEAGHRRGLFSLTDVLETRRALYDLHRTLLESLARCHRADIRIGRLVGKRPDAGFAASPEVEE